MLYAAAIFAGAFLLFQIEPMIAKAILPRFGGASSVWAACLVFFQIALLGGYAYSHFVARLSPRAQARLHIALLWGSLVLLPIAPGGRWRPSANYDPAFQILGLLAAAIGLPYMLLSTGPLLQAWYGSVAESGWAGRARSAPFRLFAVSNAGSLLGLLSYPLLVEPFLRIQRQMQLWSLLYVVFVGLASVSAWMMSRLLIAEPKHQTVRIKEGPAFDVQVLWVALPACSSTLLIGVTDYLTKDVAPIPLLWVLPLGVYLISFVLCFERDTWYRRPIFLRLLLVAFAAMVCGLSGFGRAIGLKSLIAIFVAGLLVCCTVCHGELARLKPSPALLTRFYLSVAAGGALGGIAAGLIAPRVFSDYFELPAALVACVYLPALTPDLRRNRFALIAVTAASAAVLYILFTNSAFRVESRLTVRNFYGVLHVQDSSSDPNRATRALRNGAIDHGEQFLAADRRHQPTTYYGPQSGVGLAIQSLAQSPIRVGVVGLGAGVLASYGRAGDYYRFYEINPLVIRLANSQFSFLRDCHATVEIALGDARLLLERERPQNFDVLAIDAFSGDAIPVHLLTREALELYRRHLKPEGILALHVSNRYLDLAPTLQLGVRSVGLHSVVVLNDEDPQNAILKAEWVLAGEHPGVLPNVPFAAAMPGFHAKSGIRMWTDDYSSIFSILK